MAIAGGDEIMVAATRIEVILTDLDTLDPAADAAIVSAEERARADLFRDPRHRRRFLARRATRRRLLASRIGIAPHELRFGAGCHGRPHLIDRQLEFNQASAGPVLLTAIAARLPLGCDIEAEQALDDVDGLARLCCTPRERRVLAALPPDRRSTAFIEQWVRKEAYAKAVGLGLSLPLREVDVTRRYAAMGGARVRGTAWRILGWQPFPGYRAALVAPGQAWHAHNMDQ